MEDQKTVEIYVIKANIWTTAQLSEPRHITAMATNNKILIAGGEYIKNNN